MIGVAPFLAFAPVTVTPRATVAASTITTAAPRTTIATVTAVTARFTRLARRAGVFQFLTCFLVNHAHGQAYLPTVVDLEDLDLHFLAF